MKFKKLLIVGELNVDLILNKIAGFPQVGTEIIADSMNFTLGSSSAIMASNISAMGVDTSFCGIVGNDDFGDFVLKQLQLKKVNPEFIKKSAKDKTGITVVMNYDQDRANVTYCGAMNSLGFNDIPWANIKQFQHLHLSNYFLQKGIKKDITRIFKEAKEAGLTTSLDLQWDPDDQWLFDYKNCLPYVDIFLPNEAELLALSHKDTLDEAIREIRAYCNILALKLGSKGARVCSANTNIETKPYRLDIFKDAIGAGDSFNAGFIEKFMEGASLNECLENANLMGAINTTMAGGTAAFSSLQAIQEQKDKIVKTQPL